MWITPMYNTTKLTVELGEIVKQGVNIWDFDYPSYYQGEEKKKFEQKVIDHYYFRQIGQETVGRWLHYFRTRIREIMPYYIEQYKTVEIMSNIEDPFGNVDVTETFEQEINGESSGKLKGETTDSLNGESNNNAKVTHSGTENKTENNTENRVRKFSNTPQGSIANLDNYMTEATQENNTNKLTLNGGNNFTTNTEEKTGNKTTNTGKTSSETTGTNKETLKHTLTRKGNQGVNTYAHDMIEFRQSIINVDMMIIENLNDLFLQVY